MNPATPETPNPYAPPAAEMPGPQVERRAVGYAVIQWLALLGLYFTFAISLVSGALLIIVSLRDTRTAGSIPEGLVFLAASACWLVMARAIQKRPRKWAGPLGVLLLTVPPLIGLLEWWIYGRIGMTTWIWGCPLSLSAICCLVLHFLRPGNEPPSPV